MGKSQKRRISVMSSGGREVMVVGVLSEADIEEAREGEAMAVGKWGMAGMR